MFDAIEYRGAGQENVEELAKYAGVPVYNGLTDEWHPTQMLADFMTMQERVGRPCDEIAYAFVGDGRFNMGRSLLVTGAILGSDVRIVVPEELRPPDDVVEMAAELAERSGARITITDDVAAGVEGRRLRPHRRLGLDGRAEGGLERTGGPSSAPTRSTRPCSRPRATPR